MKNWAEHRFDIVQALNLDAIELYLEIRLTKNRRSKKKRNTYTKYKIISQDDQVA